MRKGEISFNAVVYVILALIVLIVCIGVYLSITKKPISSLWQIGQDTGKQGDDARSLLDILFNRCDSDDEPRCISQKLYRCTSQNQWEKTEDAC